jgi:hypothetical protein
MAETMIMRAPKDRHNPYKAINITMANDRRLSWEARGIGFYLLTKPDNWKIYPQNLINEGIAGKDQVYRILKEFELCGYLERVKQRDEKGRLKGVVSYFHESPLHTNDIDRTLLRRKREHVETDDTTPPHPVLPETVEPDTDKPDAVQPHTEKPDTRIKGRIQLSELKESTTTSDGSDAADAAGSSGGIGKEPRDQGSETDAWLQSIGVTAAAARRKLRTIPLDVLQREWDLMDKNGLRKPGAVFAANVGDPEWQPTPAATPGPERPKAPYLLPEWATWSIDEQQEHMQAYQIAERKWRDKGGRA